MGFYMVECRSGIILKCRCTMTDLELKQLKDNLWYAADAVPPFFARTSSKRWGQGS